MLSCQSECQKNISRTLDLPLQLEEQLNKLIVSSSYKVKYAIIIETNKSKNLIISTSTTMENIKDLCNMASSLNERTKLFAMSIFSRNNTRSTQFHIYGDDFKFSFFDLSAIYALAFYSLLEEEINVLELNEIISDIKVLLCKIN